MEILSRILKAFILFYFFLSFTANFLPKLGLCTIGLGPDFKSGKIRKGKDTMAKIIHNYFFLSQTSGFFFFRKVGLVQ